MEVPPVLLSGDHQAVDRWRRQQSIERTWRLRPDLLTDEVLRTFDERDVSFLQSLQSLAAEA